MSQFWSRCRSLWVGLVLLGPVLGGCSSPAMPSFSSLFGSKSDGADVPYTPPVNFECPDVTVRQGASAFAVSATPGDTTALSQRYQLTLGETARECRVTGPTVSMKVGVRGRVILGPAGGPGQLDVPLRIAVVREGVEPRTITTKLNRITVTIPPGDPNVPFSIVEEDISFPMPKAAEIDSYVVYVGFDPVGAQEMDKIKKKPAPKPARPRRANTAQAPAQ